MYSQDRETNSIFRIIVLLFFLLEEIKWMNSLDRFLKRIIFV